MNQKKDIYCDLDFWQSLSSRFENVRMTTDLNELRQNQNLLDWYGLFSRSHLLFDCALSDFENAAIEDQYLRTAWKQSTDGRWQIDFAPGAMASMCAGPSQMDAKMYHSLYLSKENRATNASNVGVINVYSEGVLEHTELFNDNGPSIKRETRNNWAEILKTARAKQNCNSMVIADNYIFQDVNANLYRILDALLPHKLETVFYLTVFSLNEISDAELDKKKQQLEKRIQEMRPNLAVNTEVFSCTKDYFHDRGIITNYQWIEIGAGFNIFKNDGTAKKTTNVHVSYPMIIPEDRMRCSRDGYLNIIDDAKSCLRIRNKRSNNRLLR